MNTTTYSSPDAKRFFTWLDKVTDKASRSAVGKFLTPRGWEVQHTGGGCLAWEKTREDGKFFVWITSDGTDLGERLRKPEKAVFCVGFYGQSGAWLNPPCIKGLAAAMRWCHEALADPNGALEKAAKDTDQNNLGDWSISDLDPADLADRFARVLHKWLTKAEFAEMKSLNQAAEYATGCCASGNYCDSNMAMDAAIKEILPDCEIDADDEAQAALWNTAWDIARERHIGAPPK